MGFKDVIVFLSPYLAIFLFIFIIICCFLIRYTSPHHIEEQHILEQHILDEQIEDLRQDNEELEEAFRIANINRLELAESMTNYAIYLKAEMKRGIFSKDMVIFINPGDEKPVLGQLMVE